MPSKGSGEFERGYIIPIGGSENWISPETAEKLRSICLSSSANALILNVSSQKIEHQIETILLDNGFENCSTISVESRQECQQPELLSLMQDIDLLVITGERPLQISTILGGTPLAKQLRKLNADGVHTVGTYGAAALLTEHMIAAGQKGTTPTQNGVTMAPGLGLTNRFMIDYSFEQQGRLGRLLTALSYNPFALGVGIDDGTALFISPNDDLEVLGDGAATLIDPSNLKYSSMGSAGSGDPISLFGLQMHILAKGARFSAAEQQTFDEHRA